MYYILKYYIMLILIILNYQISLLWAKPTISSVEGFIPRNVDEGELYLIINVIGVDPNHITSSAYSLIQSSDLLYSKYLSIYLKEESTTHKLPWSELGETNSYIRFEILTNEKEEITENEDGTINVKFNLKITETESNALSSLISQNNDQLTFNIYFLEADSQNEAKKEDVIISRDISVADEAPVGLSIISGYKQIMVQWDTKNTITYYPSALKAPRGMSIIVIDKSLGEISIPAKVFNPNETFDTEESSCAFNPNFNDDQSCLSCSSGVYIDLSSLSQISGIFVKSTQNNYTIINHLELGKEYAVVLQYQPDGIQRSTCKTAIPQENISLSEYYGEKIAQEKDPRCFIATATYGSIFHKNVIILKEFRDRVLLKSQIGKKLVNIYYKYSPILARHIIHNKILKNITAILLQPIVMLSYIIIFSMDYFWLWIIFISIIVLSSIILYLYKFKLYKN